MSQEDLYAPILETIHQQTGADTRCHGITLPLISARLKVWGWGIHLGEENTGNRRQETEVRIQNKGFGIGIEFGSLCFDLDIDADADPELFLF